MIMLLLAGLLTTVLLAAAIYLAIADSKAEELANADGTTRPHPMQVDLGQAVRSLNAPASSARLACGQTSCLNYPPPGLRCLPNYLSAESWNQRPQPNPPMIMLLLAGLLTTVLLAAAIYLAIADSKAEELANADGTTPSHPMQVDLGQAVRSLNATASTTSNRQGTLALWIEQSGLRLKPFELVCASAGIGILAAILVALFLRIWWPSLVACLLTAPLPFAAVAVERFRRSNKLRSQLPAALDLMSRMLRAGQTIPQSLSGVADEFESPLADEFGYCYEQQNLGLSTEASMYEMARRTGVLELRILVVALTIHRQAGGNLSELLDNLAKVIRERYHIQGQIRSLTADGRMQAAILLALPPVLLVVLSIVNQEYVSILFQFPWLLIGMFAFELLGALWLHRIVSFDF